MQEVTLGGYAMFAIIVLICVYYFLITEKLNKVLVSMIGAGVLVFSQIFKTAEHSSQTGAQEFISHNLDVLGFIIGMMILVGIVRESGAFEALAIWLVKKVKGNPRTLLIVMGYLTLILTALLSNIPTVLILTPVLLVLIRELKLPFLPYFFVLVTMANIGGAMTPISDPTTYYQAKTVGLSFVEVVMNSGLIVCVCSVTTMLYALFVFKKPLAAAKVNPKDVAAFKPASAIQDKNILIIGLPILASTILLMVTKEYIAKATGVTLDNASITLFAAFLCMLLFKKEPREMFMKVVDWEIIFFFTGLFVVIGGLESTGVIRWLALQLLAITQGNQSFLLFLMSVGSGVLSTFIDNVPYNITMVGAIQAMEKAGVYVYPLWWVLNLGTSIGGAGSPIGAACNVVAFGQAEKEKFHVNFMNYLKLGVPLVVINSLVAFAITWLRYLS